MMTCLHCKTFHDPDCEEIVNNKCPDCGLDLLPSANLPAQMEKDTIQIELESRSHWIRQMNEILGYDNSDGFHSEPTPHEIAKALRKFVQDVRATQVCDAGNMSYFVEQARILLSKLRTPSVTIQPKDDLSQK